MLKRTTKEVAEYFAQQGCELLGEYRGCQTKMEYRCSCGRESTIHWNHFSNGKRCGYCKGRRKKYTIEEVKIAFAEGGLELLTTEYTNHEVPMDFRCKCGRLGKMCWLAFKQRGYRNCFACGVDKRRGDKNTSWRSDRDALKRDQKFRKKCYKALQSTLKATGKDKVGRTSDMLGYGPVELQEHISNHPNWNNVKDTNWHLDHIFPVNAFLEHGITDLKIINRLDNLQPISQRENNQKKDKYNKEEFKVWLESLNLL